MFQVPCFQGYQPLRTPKEIVLPGKQLAKLALLLKGHPVLPKDYLLQVSFQKRADTLRLALSSMFNLPITAFTHFCQTIRTDANCCRKILQNNSTSSLKVVMSAWYQTDSNICDKVLSLIGCWKPDRQLFHGWMNTS